MKLEKLISAVKTLQREAFDARDFERLDLMLEIWRTLQELGLVVFSINRLMNQPHTDEAWEALTEALDACGILHSEEDGGDGEESIRSGPAHDR